MFDAIRNETIKKGTWEHTAQALQCARAAMRTLHLTHAPQPERDIYAVLEQQFIDLHRDLERAARAAGVTLDAPDPTAQLTDPDTA